MSRVTWTHENPDTDDDPLEGIDVDIEVDVVDGEIVVGEVLRAGTYTAIPQLRGWASRLVDDLRFLDRAYEAVGDDHYWRT